MLENNYKLTFLGNEKVGKTSLLHCFTECDLQNSADILMKTFFIEGNEINLTIWDLPSQFNNDSFIPKFIRGSSGILIVFDVTNAESFQSIQKIIDLIKITEENTIVILVGNKIDLENERQIKAKEAEEFALKCGIHYFETSAKNKIGIDEFLIYITTQMYHSFCNL